ncbi:MAG TPA: choice-of-anchor tandem repeat GloVer-containing protein [Candidatus Sulfotelmatobacter sp.]
MRSKIVFEFAVAVPVLILTLTITTILCAAQAAVGQEQVLYSFFDPGGTVSPVGGVISDVSGNLYGTTLYGGANGVGMVFELSPTASGWQETILHSFNTDRIDGFIATAGLIFDAAGNLYGTTQFGGTGSCTNGFGCGTVFELSPSASGEWTETILHDFTGADGWEVHAGLTMDAAGKLYGTTVVGGAYNQGTVYQLSPAAGGHWTTNVLHHFTGGTDGGVPYGGVILDANGNVYGMTSAGGGTTSACQYGCGVVFELTPTHAADGHWTGHVLHNFGKLSGDGHYPSAGLVFDAAGNLYGTTSAGGGSGHINGGIVFELTPIGSGKWAEKIVHNFNELANDGVGPSGNLIFDASGNLYGATIGGGSAGHGTAFELTPATGGIWTETILHSFSDQGTDGYDPVSGLALYASGNLFGTTDQGGDFNQGTVFEIQR